MPKPLLLCGLRVPSNCDRFSFYRGGIFQFENFHSFRIEDSHFSFVEKYRFPGEWEECREIRCAVVFTVSETQDEGALLAGAEYRLWLFRAGEDYCISPLKAVHSLPERVF